MSLKLRNGRNIKFWTDNWLEGITLQYRFPRLYAFETFKNCTCAERYLNGVWNWQWCRNPRNGIESSQLSALMDALTNVSFNDEVDKWIWNVDNSHVFSVSNAQYLIDNANLTPGNRPTKWSKYVPIKINIFAFRLLLNRLPMKINLSDRDIDVPNILCSTCNQAQEDVSHIFIHCEVAYQVWAKIAQWTNLSFPQWSNIEDFWPWMEDSTEWEAKNHYRSHYSVDIEDHLEISK
ncbi:RNA-directed DNA polymerase, eukaryota [Tanacetum coccineum]